jgi:hypothetical protein
MNKVVFTAKMNDNDVELAVYKPTPQQKQDAKLYYNRAFKKALANESFLRTKLSDVLRDQGVWDEEKQKKEDELIEVITDGVDVLTKKGGIKKSAAKELALKVRLARLELQLLRRPFVDMDSITAEAQAEAEEYKYLVSVCTKYNDVESKSVFPNYSEYMQKCEEDFAIVAAEKFGELHYNYNPKWQHDLPENKFLKQYGYVDDDLRLVDKEGRLVNIFGQLIDKEGNLVDEKGEAIKEDAEFVPFLEDDENTDELPAPNKAKPKKV